ncbi:formyl-CoA transferase [Caballeronia calidae]|uniref:Formyl-CoA transferase n=1 Tax=Caballeronia calidae TaxID=1777139 RepID=A0A158EFM3_9BURK|nr:CoA transferase [Caballeronia calidae]SAL05583.1 formyl-CoA transferase [Caballeronia calidae]
MADGLPLSGLTVIDCGQVYNGPYAGFLLAMAGAKVIKVEPPCGENLRRRSVVGGAALPFAMLNSNKKFITLNLKSDAGREIFLDLIKKSDVLIENFAPGVMDRLNIGFDVLRDYNSRLIYATGSGYGANSEYSDMPAMDLTVQAMSGALGITGYADRAPVKCGPAICDFAGGTHLYGAIMTALYERERTGRGRKVEVAMLEAVYPTLSSTLGLWFRSKGQTIERTGNHHGGMAESPYNVYPALDGYVAVLCVTDAHWESLLVAMDRTDLVGDSRFSTLAARVERLEEVDQVVENFTQSRTRSEISAILRRLRVPFAPVRNLSEVTSDQSLFDRRFLQKINHPLYGETVLPTSPIRFDNADPMTLEPSGELGRDNDEILSEFAGLDAQSIERLRASGAI